MSEPNTLTKYAEIDGVSVWYRKTVRPSSPHLPCFHMLGLREIDGTLCVFQRWTLNDDVVWLRHAAEMVAFHTNRQGGALS